MLEKPEDFLRNIFKDLHFQQLVVDFAEIHSWILIVKVEKTAGKTMFGLSGSSMLKYGQDIDYIGTWGWTILGVPKKVCVSVENMNIFEKLSVTVFYRTQITGDSDSMRERLLVSMKMTEF